ncbi:hypothetical protein IID24_00570 [Patescibacteria group bacterium]|nr:hypothetical protein [Patescibacteria group bacterium]
MQNELYSFVKESLEKGIERSAIQQALLQAGWQEEEVKNALATFADVQFPVPVPKPKPYVQAREAFLYLVSFIALYITAFSFAALLFAFVDKFFPDPIAFRDFSSRGLTTAIASIIIAFPLYLFMMRRLTQAEIKDSERRRSKVAKWLTYTTLVIAAAIIIGDLIAIVSSLLSGEFTVRFILKAFTILAVTGSIFGYYLWNLRRGEKEGEEEQVYPQRFSLIVKIFLSAVVLSIVASVVYGFVLVGSPAQQRLMQFDKIRVSDLQDISFAIDAYWERNEQLPEKLEDLQKQTFPVRSIQDPKAGELYEYTMLGNTTYELCAVFETDSSEQQEEFRKPFSAKAWEYGIGRTCFEREVQKPLDPIRVPIPAVE